jgi:hypothetical protein
MIIRGEVPHSETGKMKSDKYNFVVLLDKNLLAQESVGNEGIKFVMPLLMPEDIEHDRCGWR